MSGASLSRRLSGRDEIPQTVAVFGASGFVGKAIVEALSQKGVTVRAVYRGNSDTAHPNSWILSGNDDDLPRLIEGCGAVINCIGRAHILKLEDPDSAAVAFDRINNRLAASLARSARAAGTRRFVQISSVAAITSSVMPGTCADDTTRETPGTIYGRSKLAGDRAILDLETPEFRPVCLRPPAIYGPGARGWFPLFRWAAEVGLPLPLGAVNNARSFAFIDNIAEAVLATLGSDESGAYIVTDSEPVSTGIFYRHLLNAYGKPDRVWRIPILPMAALLRALWPGGASRMLGDAAYCGARFENTFQWRARIAMAEGLARTVARGET